ncbi:hypothetical protein [Bacillus sp. SRB1LM]|uniref:hypothetical protein n=1 Tax=Bacillus sp. SRB1LM TaxID=2608688 RepID=UPI0018C399F9|nr:hypothetical protein [Bacillus sp. SRB1LM]MBG0965166.1 hypothetical protein [Bacillus sp. SRB1LM]
MSEKKYLVIGEALIFCFKIIYEHCTEKVIIKTKEQLAKANCSTGNNFFRAIIILKEDCTFKGTI